MEEMVRLTRRILNEKGEEEGNLLLKVEKTKYNKFLELLEQEPKPISNVRRNELMDQAILNKKATESDENAK